MSLKAVNIKEKDYDNYMWREVTFAPPKGKLMTHKQIRKFCSEFQSKLPKGTSMIVRGENILRFTKLYSTYTSDKWLTDAEYDEYLKTLDIPDPEKFNSFFNFTITIRKDITDDPEAFDDVDEFDDKFA
jgi:hypothetical protein